MNLTQAFDRREAMEYRLSALYAHFQRLFAADAEAAKLFACLSSDEVSHAGIISFQRRFAAKGELPVELGVDMGAVESMITRIDGLMEQSPSLEEALRLSLEMEASSAELHYKAAAEQADSGIARLVKGLGDQDNMHHRRLSAFIVARFDREQLASNFGGFIELLAEWNSHRLSGQSNPKFMELSDRIEKTLDGFKNMSHYEKLSVGPDASPEGIRHAFHRAVKEWHPDRYAGYPDDIRARLQAIAAGINEANAVLSNAGRRSEYDRLLARKVRLKVPAVPQDEQEFLEGMSRLAEKDHAGAFQAFDAAKRLSPKAKYSYHCAAALRGLGRRKEALEEIHTALEKSPTSSACHLLAAEVSLEIGDKAGAERAFRRVMELDPGNERAGRGLEKIAAGSPTSFVSRLFRKRVE